MLLLFHIIFGCITTGISLYTLRNKPAEHNTAKLFFSIIGTYAATLTSGLILLFAGSDLLRICVSGIIFSAVSIYTILKLYRTNHELRIEF